MRSTFVSSWWNIVILQVCQNLTFAFGWCNHQDIDILTAVHKFWVWRFSFNEYRFAVTHLLSTLKQLFCGTLSFQDVEVLWDGRWWPRWSSPFMPQCTNYPLFWPNCQGGAVTARNLLFTQHQVDRRLWEILNHIFSTEFIAWQTRIRLDRVINTELIKHECGHEAAAWQCNPGGGTMGRDTCWRPGSRHALLSIGSRRERCWELGGLASSCLLAN